MIAIDQYQFKLQMDRLIDAFGDKPFSEQRELMIWESCKGSSYNLVIAVVDDFIRKSKAAPLPIEFAEAIAEAEKASGLVRHHLGEVRPKEFAKCFICGDSGFVRLKRNKEFEAWAKWQIGSAPCHCTQGLKVTKNKKHDFGPQFAEHWLKSYTTLPAYEHLDEREPA